MSSVRALSLPFLSSLAFDYDLVVIGAGASGLFAAGTASSLGCKTLLLEQSLIGGDCTNAACVPSKAVRSVANMASKNCTSSIDWMNLAQRHASDTVRAVQEREDPRSIAERNPNLDIEFVEACRFTSSHELEIVPRSKNSTADTYITVKSKKFLIATGASPIVPHTLESEAKAVGLPIYTYRTVLNQVNDDKVPSIWSILDGSGSKKQVLIAGGGSTACEIGQALARLSGEKLDITIVAPTILPNQDVTLRESAIKLLTRDGIKLYLNRRVAHVDGDRPQTVLDNGTRVAADALILCVGRSPGTPLSLLNLEAANVQWNPQDGVLVNEATLASPTARHVYACGDCCSAIAKSRRGSAHAGWTGFHAARNAVLPSWFLVGATSLCPTVPTVVYTHPELASVGLSYTECVKKYGKDGFDRLFVTEEGMDRADMERLERHVDIGFVELRATKVDGRVLGMTACGPAAAELANEVGLAIASKLTVRNVARALHSYPSHGYLLHRIALAMATSSTLGLLSACGPIGRSLAVCGRVACKAGNLFRPGRVLAWKRKGLAHLRNWEADGANKAAILYTKGIGNGLVVDSKMEEIKLLAFLDAYQNKTIYEEMMESETGGLGVNPSLISHEDRQAFRDWIDMKPLE